jgi:hypothetical protein
MDELKDMVKM